MSATIEVVCYKSKVLANNESPLMLRITKDRRLKYSSIGVSVRPECWDFERNKPRRNCPNRLHIERLIADKIEAYRTKMIELQAENKEFTATSLHERVADKTSKRTVGEVFQAQIENLKRMGRTGYALSHQEVCNSLLKFNGHLNICFSDIDTVWLKRYETWLRGQGFSENTIGRRFRTLRAVYNVAIEEKCVKPDCYPFKSYKVSKLHRATAKRAIRKADIMRIIEYRCDDFYRQFAVDLFAFGYFMGGINFVDIAYLKTDNIVAGRLIYTRRKTHKLIRLPLQPKAQEIIERYRQDGTSFLFPILSAFHKTEQQQRNRIHKVITKVNRALKEVGRTLNIPIDLTTYVARHSFATVLKREGVSTSIICESLGHSSEKVTQIYLDSFENAQIDEAMKHLL
ncbi:site-specific integrase [uncultured Rikenella sp.]|uniref:site-specific integrase n=1 Tax=uncultured Rikenella sp. TaxID=368003 RepID=UPI00262C4AAA|nr:site-specific integrase [uncultured Rikenella sp.]